MAREISNEMRRIILRKMIDARSQILLQYPFYGQLVMHLQLGITDCGTACTDMKHLMFDPDFALKLSQEEMVFVMLHEVLHCVLEHCTRGRNYAGEKFNIACDIVVNSNILYSMGIREFSVQGMAAMHLAPNGKEGHCYSAEEVYEMLIKDNMENDLFLAVESQLTGDAKAQDNGSGFDSHEIWAGVSETDASADQWREHVKKASRSYSKAQIPPSAREYIRDLEQKEKVDWRKVLADFIQIYYDRFDYSYQPSDRRYSYSDFVIPSFSEQEGEKLENLWFCVDTSGSISIEVLSEVMSEIRQVLALFEHFRGKLSFFDTSVTDPVEFEELEDVEKMQPIGGGGTSFEAVFSYMKQHMEEDLPTAIIVLTDGYCDYPDVSAAMNFPVPVVPMLQFSHHVGPTICAILFAGKKD